MYPQETREKIIKRILFSLKKHGFSVSQYNSFFDLIAKKDFLLLIKILLNIDSFNYLQAECLKILSSFISAKPFLIGLRTRKQKMEDFVVYDRFEIPAMTPKGFENLFEGVYPFVYAKRGGYFVELDFESIKEKKQELNLSLNQLAKEIGVSRKTIEKCESGGKFLLEKALILEEVLNTCVVKPITLDKEYKIRHLEPKNEFEKEISDELERIGFEYSFLNSTQFNLLIKKSNVLISKASENKKNLINSTSFIKSVSESLGLNPVLITEKSRKNSIFGIPIIERKELKEIEDNKDFIYLIEKKSAS